MGDFLMSRARRLFQYADLQSSHDESGSDGPMATCATARRKKVLLIGGLATSVLLIVIVAAGMRHSARPALQTAPEADYSKDFRPGSSPLDALQPPRPGLRHLLRPEIQRDVGQRHRDPLLGRRLRVQRPQRGGREQELPDHVAEYDEGDPAPVLSPVSGQDPFAHQAVVSVGVQAVVVREILHLAAQP